MKLNLGCGMKYLDGYVNADFSEEGSNGSKIKVDEIYNFLDGIPYPNDYVDEAMFTDVLEHFNRHNGVKVLQHIFRVLKPAGKFLITVPPALLQMKTFIRVMESQDDLTMDDFTRAHEKFSYWKWHDDVAGATHTGNGMDGDSHKTFYTAKALKSIMEHVGFKILSVNDQIIKIEATK